MLEQIQSDCNCYMNIFIFLYFDRVYTVTAPFGFSLCLQCSGVLTTRHLLSEWVCICSLAHRNECRVFISGTPYSSANYGFSKLSIDFFLFALGYLILEQMIITIFSVFIKGESFKGNIIHNAFPA